MYFVRYEPLKQKLRSRSLSDREALSYFILVNACLTLAGAIATEGWNAFDTLSMWLSVFFCNRWYLLCISAERRKRRI